MDATPNEQKTETELQGCGATGTRLTPEHIDSVIKGVKYHQFDSSTLIVCAIELENGFRVTGESACVSGGNFNASIGMRLAYEDARKKIWALEGYLLRQKLHEAKG